MHSFYFYLSFCHLQKMGEYRSPWEELLVRRLQGVACSSGEEGHVANYRDYFEKSYGKMFWSAKELRKAVFVSFVWVLGLKLTGAVSSDWMFGKERLESLYSLLLPRGGKPLETFLEAWKIHWLENRGGVEERHEEESLCHSVQGYPRALAKRRQVLSVNTVFQGSFQWWCYQGIWGVWICRGIWFWLLK